MTNQLVEGIPVDVGTRIGPYRVESFLARGGMGVVVRAVDENLGRPVAIKLIDPSLGRDEEFVERFRRECRVLAQLRHPNIVTVYYQDSWEGALYFAMELVGGFSLQRILEDMRRLDWRTSVQWMIQCCDALEAVRPQDIVHRDLKPANILIDEDNQVRIVDFGLAKSNTSTDPQLTSAQVFLGTPHYVSPEQARGRPLDWRSDLYSLGATFYPVFSGRNVFEAPSVAEIVAMHIREKPRPLAELAPDLPSELTDLIDRCLQKDPAARGEGGYGPIQRELDAILGRGSNAASLSQLAAGATIPGADHMAMSVEEIDLEALKLVSGQTKASGLAVVPDPPQGPGTPALYAWLEDEAQAPGAARVDVALVRAPRLVFGSRQGVALFLPDDPANRRISGEHGAFVATGAGWSLEVRVPEGRRVAPQVRLGPGSPLEPGLHAVEPGQVVDVRGQVGLRLAGSQAEGLAVHLQEGHGEVIRDYVGRWYWVLVGEQVVAGEDPACGLRLPAGAGARCFALRVDADGAFVEALGDRVQLDGRPLEGRQRLEEGARIHGEGFAYRFSPRPDPDALWKD